MRSPYSSLTAGDWHHLVTEDKLRVAVAAGVHTNQPLTTWKLIAGSTLWKMKLGLRIAVMFVLFTLLAKHYCEARPRCFTIPCYGVKRKVWFLLSSPFLYNGVIVRFFKHGAVACQPHTFTCHSTAAAQSRASTLLGYGFFKNVSTCPGFTLSANPDTNENNMIHFFSTTN